MIRRLSTYAVQSHLDLKWSVLSKFKFKNMLKKTINKLFLNDWYTTRQDYCSGKLDTYCKLKTHFGCEKYINEIRNFSYRRSITRFRISAHRLKIETGRYIKLDRSERLCTKCSTGAIEDEQHFLMECSKFNAFRNSFFFKSLMTPTEILWSWIVSRSFSGF